MLNTVPMFLKAPTLPVGDNPVTPGAVKSAVDAHGQFASLMQQQADQQVASQRLADQRSQAARDAVPARPAEPHAANANTAPKRPAEASSRPSEKAATPPAPAAAKAPAASPSQASQRQDEASESPQPEATAAPVDSSAADGIRAANNATELPGELSAIQAAIASVMPTTPGLPTPLALAGSDALPGQALRALQALHASQRGAGTPAAPGLTPSDDPAADATGLGDDTAVMLTTADTATEDSAAVVIDPAALQPWLQGQALVAGLGAPLHTHAAAGMGTGMAADTSTTALAAEGQRRRAALTLGPDAPRSAGQAAAPGTAAQDAAADALVVQAPGQAGVQTDTALAPAGAKLQADTAGASEARDAADASLQATASPTDTAPAAALAAASAAAQWAAAPQAAPSSDTPPEATDAKRVAGPGAASARSSQVSGEGALQEANPSAGRADQQASATTPGQADTQAMAATGALAGDTAPAGGRGRAITDAAADPADRAVQTARQSATPDGANAAAPQRGAGDDRQDGGRQGRQGDNLPSHLLRAADGVMAAQADIGSPAVAATEPAGRALEGVSAAAGSAAPAASVPNPGGAGVMAGTPAAGTSAAPAPQAEARLAMPMNSPAFAPALGAQITVFARDGVQTAQLHLNPAEMGPILVSIAVDGQSARVDFQAERAATRDVIEASLPALAGALQDAGLTLTGGGVSQQPSQQGRQPQPEAGQLAQPAGPRGREADLSTALPAGARPQTGSRGLVDLIA